MSHREVGVLGLDCTCCLNGGVATGIDPRVFGVDQPTRASEIDGEVAPCLLEEGALVSVEFAKIAGVLCIACSTCPMFSSSPLASMAQPVAGAAAPRAATRVRALAIRLLLIIGYLRELSLVVACSVERYRKACARDVGAPSL
jgi:hypothetical protein